MDREDWGPFLERWSEEWITAHDPERDAPLAEEVLKDRWLGFGPASDDEIAAAQTRLGCSLPPSLREFLRVTNGWRDAGPFIYRLAGTKELAWLRDSDEVSGWIDAYSDLAEEGEPDEGEILARSLRLSLEGDAAVLVLDPEDVDDNGEWAAYWLASWSGMGPERHDSFYDLMYDLYTSFHNLRKPAGDTRDGWDTKIEQARFDLLAGEFEEPMAVLEEASEFGRDRATLLRFQVRAMLDDWATVPLDHVVKPIGDCAALLQDPLFATEFLPLLFAEDRLTHRDGRWLTLEHLLRIDRQPAERLIAEFEARQHDPAFRLTFGNPEFDAAVHRILDRLKADLKAEDGADTGPARRSRTDAAWPGLKKAVALWRPLTEDHIAPVVLFADPLLAEIITPDRGKEILEMRRSRQARVSPVE
jgi:cell wall assembly regulator SMI1